jgi:hypothetical protein
MRAEILALSAALALAGCQKPASPAAGAAAPNPGGGAPQRRAGLWQQSFNRDGAPTPMAAMKVCVDAASETKASVFSHDADAKGLDKLHCSQRSMSRGVDGSYSFSSTCPMPGGGTMTTHGQAAGDFASGYHMHVESDVSGAAYAPMNGHHVTDIDGKWLGPCPTGMAAGDMELANGMKLSGGKLAGAAAALARGGQ